jgi:hypothetical protein
MKQLKLENMKILSEGERFDDSVLAYDKEDNGIFYLFINDEIVAHTKSDLLQGKGMPFTEYFNKIHSDMLEQMTA